MARKLPKVLNVVVDQRFKRCPEGRIWTFTPPSYAFFEAALKVFDRVRVIARTQDVSSRPVNAREVVGDRVELLPVPSYVGPVEYIRRRPAVLKILEAYSELDGCFLFRIPSQMAFVMAESLERKQRPYAVELLTDPHEFFAPGVAPNGLAFLFRPYFRRRSRELCQRAIAVNYVTGSYTCLANPPAAGAWSSNLSDVELPLEAFLHARRPASPDRPIRVVSVGFLDLLYKGQDVLIQTVAAAKAAGQDFDLTLIGDGQQRTNLIAMANSLGIGDRVHITGALGGPGEVRKLLLEADLFSLPSRAEGIPRALLEAMAAGLPAICSHVGAMGDLLEARWLVPPNSVEILTEKFLDFARNRELWPRIGQRNQDRVRGFVNTALGPQRLGFYQAIYDLTIKGIPQISRRKEVTHAA